MDAEHPRKSLGDPEPEGNTPLDLDEEEGLLEKHIDTRAALNAWEQLNIFRAEEWAFSRRGREILTTSYALELHRRMFGDTWAWAGTLRRSDKNIGVPWPTVGEQLGQALHTAAYWLENGTYPIDEAVTRLHHRIVWVHPFPNGNGRHGRLMADALLWNSGYEPFTWGRVSLNQKGAARDRYLTGLRRADRGDLVPLLDFVRS